MRSNATPAAIYLDATTSEAHFYHHLLSLADKDVSEALLPITMPSVAPRSSKKQRSESTSNKSPAQSLAGDDMKAAKAAGYLTVIDRSAHNTQWRTTLKAFPAGLCFQNALLKSYCRHGATGNLAGKTSRGQVSEKCRYKHTSWNRLSVDEQAKVRTFCTAFPGIYKLETE